MSFQAKVTDTQTIKNNNSAKSEDYIITNINVIPKPKSEILNIFLPAFSYFCHTPKYKKICVKKIKTIKKSVGDLVQKPFCYAG